MKKVRKFLRTILSVCAAAIFMGIVPACASREPEKSGPRFVAHRGYSHSYVANTKEAFLAATQMDFYGIETDVRKTKDGYYVCNHDATVEYADGTAPLLISDHTLAELLTHPLKNDVTSEDAYLCTFETYLRVCKEGGKVAVIELKDYFVRDDLQKLLAIVDTEYDRDHVSFISFSYTPLTQIKKMSRFVDVQYLSQTENDSRFEDCLRDGISIDVKQTILTEELVQAFHDAGLTVNVWTVNEVTDLQSVYRLGVDYITTDVFDKV